MILREGYSTLPRLTFAHSIIAEKLMIKSDSARSLLSNTSFDSANNLLKPNMVMRYRRGASSDLESTASAGEFAELSNRNAELEMLVSDLKKMLDISRHREKKILLALDSTGTTVKLDFDKDDLLDEGKFEDPSFVNNMVDRGSWLIGLLIFQSCSSFILAYNEKMLQTHPSIIYFLTMLVGAGGNAGNQATVRVIRELALGRLPDGTKLTFVLREVCMAFALSIVVGIFGYVRVYLNGGVTTAETITVTIALMMIVFISIIVGALLPILFQVMKLDPANSSTTIQVIMDISGVMITCFAATLILDIDLADGAE